MFNLTNEYRNINISIFVQSQSNLAFLIGSSAAKKIFNKKKTDFSASFLKKVLYNILR